VQEGNVVSAGVAELARLQGMGFAYIHPWAVGLKG